MAKIKIKKSNEELRKGQVIYDFLRWMYTNHSMVGVPNEIKVADPFFIPDDMLDRLYQQFYNEQKKERKARKQKLKQISKSKNKVA